MTEQTLNVPSTRRASIAMPLILLASVLPRLAAALYLGNTVEALLGT